MRRGPTPTTSSRWTRPPSSCTHRGTLRSSVLLAREWLSQGAHSTWRGQVIGANQRRASSRVQPGDVVGLLRPARVVPAAHVDAQRHHRAGHAGDIGDVGLAGSHRGPDLAGHAPLDVRRSPATSARPSGWSAEFYCTTRAMRWWRACQAAKPRSRPRARPAAGRRPAPRPGPRRQPRDPRAERAAARPWTGSARTGRRVTAPPRGDVAPGGRREPAGGEGLEPGADELARGAGGEQNRASSALAAGHRSRRRSTWPHRIVSNAGYTAGLDTAGLTCSCRLLVRQRRRPPAPSSSPSTTPSATMPAPSWTARSCRAWTYPAGPPPPARHLARGGHAGLPGPGGPGGLRRWGGQGLPLQRGARRGAVAPVGAHLAALPDPRQLPRPLPGRARPPTSRRSGGCPGSAAARSSPPSA